MLPLPRDLRNESHLLSFGCALRVTVGQRPYRGSTIAVFRVGPDRVAALEGEVPLDVVDGREIVILDLAELQETV